MSYLSYFVWNPPCNECSFPLLGLFAPLHVSTKLNQSSAASNTILPSQL